MQNNQMNFDPMTGQPINQNNTIISNQVPLQNSTVQPVPTQITQTDINLSTQPVNNTLNVQQQIQNIPTIEQSKQDFINKTQANNTVKNEEKKDRPNILFIAILFIIIFAAIFFLFPYLLQIL